MRKIVKLTFLLLGAVTLIASTAEVSNIKWQIPYSVGMLLLTVLFSRLYNSFPKKVH